MWGRSAALSNKRQKLQNCQPLSPTILQRVHNIYPFLQNHHYSLFWEHEFHATSGDVVGVQGEKVGFRTSQGVLLSGISTHQHINPLRRNSKISVPKDLKAASALMANGASQALFLANWAVCICALSGSVESWVARLGWPSSALDKSGIAGAKLKIFKIRFWTQVNLKEGFFYDFLPSSCPFKAITEVDKNLVEQLFPSTRRSLIHGVTVRWEVFSTGHANTAASSCWLPCHCSTLREMCEAGFDRKNQGHRPHETICSMAMVACQPGLAAFEGLRKDQKVAPHRKRSGHYGICRARRDGSVGLGISKNSWCHLFLNRWKLHLQLVLSRFQRPYHCVIPLFCQIHQLLLHPL